jgi:hypothetical protein
LTARRSDRLHPVASSRDGGGALPVVVFASLIGALLGAILGVEVDHHFYIGLVAGLLLSPIACVAAFGNRVTIRRPAVRRFFIAASAGVGALLGLLVAGDLYVRRQVTLLSGRLSQVKLGMREADVLRIAGQPDWVVDCRSEKTNANCMTGTNRVLFYRLAPRILGSGGYFGVIRLERDVVRVPPGGVGALRERRAGQRTSGRDGRIRT